MIHALAWLLIGYSDGAIYYLMELTGTSGYLVHLMPVFALYSVGLLFAYRLRITRRLMRRQILIAALSIGVGLGHAILIGNLYVEGYAQLCVMVCMIFLVTDLYADNADTLRPGFARGMPVVHYILCGYILLSWVALRQFDVDISLFIADTDQLIKGSTVRTSGLHREPSWAGYAVASSYLAVHLSRRTRLLLPQIAFLVAVAATGAGSGLLLAGLFCGHQIVTARNTGLTVRIALLAGLAALALVVFSGRIAEVLDSKDPSTQMRVESAFVAAEVIANSFPVGTGFGNYRDIANFDEELWRGFLDLDQAEYYKSDLLALNLIAELGLFGCVLVVLLIRNVLGPGTILVAATVVVLLFSAGSLIIPYHLVLAATAGLEMAKARSAARRPVTA